MKRIACWAGVAVGVAGAAVGADYTWLSSPASAAWNTADANWSGAGSVWVNGSGNSASFVGSDTKSITADSVTLQHLTFGADGYTISGGPLLMYGSPTVSNGLSAVISATVTNVGVWTKGGFGTLTLSPDAAASNVFYALKVATGTLHVTSGTTLVTQNGSLPESAPLLWVTSGGRLVVGGGVLKTTGNNFSRVSEYGTLLITNGLVDLRSNNELLNGHNTPGVVTVSDSGVLDVNLLRLSQTQVGPASATAVNINTGGVIRLTRFGLDTAAWRYGTVNFNGGTVVAKDTLNQQDLLGTTHTNWRNIVVNVLPGGAIIDNNSCNFTIRQNMTGTPGDGGLTKLNSGTLYARGTNSYTGATRLRGGTLNIIRDHNLGAVPAAPQTNLLFLASSTLQSSESHTLSAGRTLWISNSVTATLDPQSYTQTILGRILCASTNATVYKVGSGTVVLDPGAQAESEFGTLHASAGTLVVASGTNRVTSYCGVQNGPGLRVSGGTLLVAGGVLATTSGKYVNVDGGHLLITNGLVNTLSCDEVLNSIGGNGTGRTTVSGSGVLEARVVRISQNGGSPSNSVVNVNTGGVMRLNNFYIDVNATQKGLLNLNGGTVASRGSTADFLGTTHMLVGNNNDRWLTNITVNVLEGGAIFDFALDNHIKQPLYGAVPNDGGLTKRGAGLMLLANTNTFAGGTRVEAGTLRLFVDHTLLPGTAVTVASNAVLDVNGRVQALSALGGGGLVTNNALLSVTGELTPGDAGAYGTLTLASPCALSGLLKVALSSDGACDRLHVQGDLDLSGLALEVSDTAALNKDKRYTLATCAGTLSGAFSGHNLPLRWNVRTDTTGRRVYLLYNAGTCLSLK